jgi:uncharacterized RDD family membrane protein YckC
LASPDGNPVRNCELQNSNQKRRGRKKTMSTEPIRYGGFWRRLGALLLDVLIQLPITAVFLWGRTQSRLFSVYAWAPLMIFAVFYNVYLVRRYGGTPGKLIAGVRIRKVDGSVIGYAEAVLRFLPEFLISLFSNIALLAPLFDMTDSAYLSLSFLEREQRLVQLASWWYRPASITGQIWMWSEFIVLLTNRKRRALHDFIAGTIVVIHAPAEPLAQATTTAAAPE